MRDKNRGPLFMVLASLCWSLGGVCIKFIPWSAMSIIGLRALLAAGVFAGYRASTAGYRGSVKINFTAGNILGALCLSATTILFVFANKNTTAAAAILLQFTAPVFILLLQLVIYKTKPKPAESVAVCVTILGMLLFFADRLEPGGLLGNLCGIASGLSFAGVFLCNKRPDTNPEQALFLGFLINAAAGLPFAFFSVTADFKAWGLILLLGVVQVGLAYVFFSEGIKRTPALFACLITALEPVLNPVWVALAMGELPGPFALAGGVVIVAAVVCYHVWAERKERANAETSVEN